MKPSFQAMVTRPHQMIALAFGLGLSPMAPGTLGSLGGFALFLALMPAPLVLKIALYGAIIALSSWAAARCGEDFGKKDHGAIVIDEVVGMSLVLEFARIGAVDWIAAFLLFRLFDVWKPWPVYLADQSPDGGFMVIFDDILAAGWAIVTLLIAYQAIAFVGG